MSQALLNEYTILNNRIAEIEVVLTPFVEQQIKLTAEAVKQAYPQYLNALGARYLTRTDWFEFDSYGEVKCWERGRWGDQDEVIACIKISPLVLEGKLDEFSAQCIKEFESLKVIDTAIEIARRKHDLEQTRIRLQRQIDALDLQQGEQA
jgi:hypothetical protein